MNQKGFLFIETLVGFLLLMLLIGIVGIMLKSYYERREEVNKQKFILSTIKNYQEIHRGDCFYFSEVQKVKNLNQQFEYLSLLNGFEYYLYFDDELNPVNASQASFYFYLRYEHMVVNQNDIYCLLIKPFILESNEIIEYFTIAPSYAIEYE